MTFKDRRSSNISDRNEYKKKSFALHKYHFDILNWHAYFSDLIAIEEFWNIMKRRCDQK